MSDKSAAPMSTGGPHITVLMPVFNAMPYLPAEVESLIGQTYRQFTLLALDDGSTDGSVEFLRTHPDPRIKLISDGQHYGMGALLNRGIAMAQGSLVARMDADDLCSPDRFARQVAAFRDDPGLVAVGMQFAYVGQKGRQGFARRLPLTHALIHEDLRRGTLCVIHASLMIRPAALRAIGGYRFAGVGEDWDMFLRLAEVGRFANLPDGGYLYRLHANNATTLHLRLTQRRIRFACACAEARRSGVPEPDEPAWIATLDARPRVSRLTEAADSFGVAQYFTGRNLVLNGRSVRGYAHLAVGMLASPRRVASRLSNFIRSRTKLLALAGGPMLPTPCHGPAKPDNHSSGRAGG